MPTMTVRRNGNSLCLNLPKDLVTELGLHEEDRVEVKLERVPDIMEFAGCLKGIVTAEELDRITDEGEDLG